MLKFFYNADGREARKDARPPAQIAGRDFSGLFSFATAEAHYSFASHLLRQKKVDLKLKISTKFDFTNTL